VGGPVNTQAVVILYNIRSAYNVGSIFRTADAVGISKLYLVGYTATPIDRFGRAQKEIAKVALGAEQSVNWEHQEDIIACIEALKKEGFSIIGVEQDDNSIDYKDVEKSEKIAFVFGNEPDGLTQEVLSMCDSIAEITMHGTKESLNVAVSAGVALYGILHR